MQGLCKGVLVSAIEILDLLCPGRVTELADGFVFDLADAFTGNAEDLADLLERMRPAVIHAEAHAQHVCLTLGQRAEDLGQRFGEHRVGRGVDGAGGIVVLDEGADGRILLVADRHVQRQGVVAYVENLFPFV